MGLFGPYIYENKSKKKYWLHSTKRGKSTLYFFSKDPRGAINSLPGGHKVVENPMTGFPFVKKKAGGGLFKKTGDKNISGEESQKV
jgi:hypothetical protein